jgi:hypothetical protein
MDLNTVSAVDPIPTSTTPVGETSRRPIPLIQNPGFLDLGKKMVENLEVMVDSGVQIFDIEEITLPGAHTIPDKVFMDCYSRVPSTVKQAFSMKVRGNKNEAMGTLRGHVKFISQQFPTHQNLQNFKTSILEALQTFYQWLEQD